MIVATISMVTTAAVMMVVAVMIAVGRGAVLQAVHQQSLYSGVSRTGYAGVQGDAHLSQCHLSARSDAATDQSIHTIPFAAVFVRLVCHVLSGILIWGSYAPEGTPVWIYSVTYNGSYMLAEAIVSTVVMCLLASVLDFKTLRRPKKEVV